MKRLSSKSNLSPPAEKQNSYRPNGDKHGNTNDDRRKQPPSVLLKKRISQPQKTDKLRHKEHGMITESRNNITAEKG